ncbi:MAG TPA: PepSY domain-containing protein [Azonexus sp.]|nr:PepSY domain-containing protein [Azonexus sp.]
MTRSPLISRLLRRWHRRFGLAAAGFFVFLGVSGLLLNHGDTFELDSVQLGTPWLMAWYGLKPAVPEQGFEQEGLLFAAQGETWVFGQHKLKSGHGEPVGAVHAAGQLWIATNSEIDLFDADGRLVDKIEHDLLPGTPIRRIGSWNGQLLANIGSEIFTTADGIAWIRLASDARMTWSRLQPLSATQQQALAPFFAPSLPLQRVVADVHSGRIFGRYGVLLVDALTAALLLLSGSGLWIYYKSSGKRAKAVTPGSATPGTRS